MLLKIQINDIANEQDIEKIAKLESTTRLLRNIPYKEYLILGESLSKESLKVDDLLIVSFIYSKEFPEILGSVIIKGSKRKGKKLLKLINKNILKSNLKDFVGPARFYIAVDDNKVLRHLHWF